MAKKEKPRTSDSTLLVNEKGLAAGSGELADGVSGNNSDTSEIGSGIISATGGTGVYTYALMGSAAGKYGTLSLNSATGAYTYTLTTRYDTSPDANNGTNTEIARDTFTYRVTDAAGEAATATLRINIIDDVPTARADVASVAQGGTDTGNVLTDGVDDTFGADGPTLTAGGVVGAAKGAITTSPVIGGLGGAGIVGDYGTLTIGADGAYSYKANAQVPANGAIDHFVYTIKDGDGDTSTATIDITVTGGTDIRFNVRDFGAKGDGVTNDQAAFAAAIQAAAQAGGGVVDVPAGTYRIGVGGPAESDGAIELLSGVTLKGAGMGLTVLKLVDNVGQQINGFVRTPVGEATHDVALLDLTLDGNRANNVAKANAFLCGVLPGSDLAVENVTISNVEVRNFTGYGFDPHEKTINLVIENSVAHGNGIDGFVADFQIDGVFRNNISYNNDRHGFNIVTSTSNFLLENNIAHDNGGTGITIQRGSDPTYAFTNNIIIDGGSVYQNGTTGIEVKLAADVTLSGIDIHDNGKAGIKISGSENVTVIDNTLVNNGLSGSSGYYDAISIVDQLDSYSGTTYISQNTVVQNNVIQSTGAVQTGYGISENSSALALTSFSGNLIDGMKRGDVLIDGQRYDQSGGAIGANGVYDVTHFGAKGDGVNDDTAEIQAAIDAAHAAGGGTVYLGAGTYKVSGTSDKSDGCIRLLDNVTLQGAGMGQTILKVMDNNPYAITGVVRTPYNEVTHDVAMFDLTIDGNRANNVNKIDGFYCGVAPGDLRQDYDITIERVEVMNCTGYGFDPHEQTLNLRIADSISHHNVLDGFVADFLVDSVYENNLAYANDRHGFNVTTSTTGLLLLNNVAHDNGSSGVVVQRGSEDIPAPQGVIIEGGAYFGNAREGIYLKIADNVSITGSEVYGNQRQGIRIDGATDVVVDGVTVYNNSQEAAGVYDEIRINRYNDTAGASGLIFDTTGVVVENSTIYSNAAILSRYAIYEAPDVEGVNGEALNTIGPAGTGFTYFAPQLVDPAEDQAATAGAAFTYQVAPASFADGDDGAFVLSATQATGAALPSWLTFDPATGLFSGTPSAAGTFQIVVQARDAQGLKDTTTFALAVTGGAASVDIFGTSGNDDLIGGAGPENIYGLAGDDGLTGAGGADRLDGGEGVDTASYAGSSSGVSADLQAGTGAGGDADADTLVFVENLTGSAFMDQLAGDAGDNVLLGGAGNDTLLGRAGADTLDGGTGADRLEGGDGNDLYFIDDADDTIVESDNLGAGGIDAVRSTVSQVLAANVENLTLLGSANIDVIGNGKANVLIGNDGANLLDGGLGNDIMEGGLGDDTYVVNTSSDITTEQAGEGADTIRSTVTRTLAANIENLTLLSAVAINGTGNSLDNVLTGNEAINILTANEGDDTLFGGGGNDTLKGGGGADILDGQAGADRMEGGDGNDLFHVDDSGDTVVELANAGLGGLDTVRSSVSLALAPNVENLTLTGTAALNGTGTGSANILIGNDRDNVLEGLAGNDALQGGSGNDRLIGGSGSDSLDGGAGQDIAVFSGDVSTYTISTSGGAILIKDNDSVTDGNDGTDTLIGVETAEFKGGATANLLAPIVLDLDGDGIELVDLSESAAMFDFRGDGVRTHIGWIGSGDALLVIDRDGNGTVSNAGELSFVGDERGARSDLDGLSAFDTNDDGVISLADDSFASFMLWSDVDGDGAANASELAGLSAAGIAEISLEGVATERNWSDGENIVVNSGAFLWTDGSSGALADVAFRHDPVEQNYFDIELGQFRASWSGELAL